MALIIILTNASNCADWSTYNYRVLVGDGTPEHSTVLEAGTVGEHFRAWGWQRLIKQFVTERKPTTPTPSTVSG